MFLPAIEKVQRLMTAYEGEDADIVVHPDLGIDQKRLVMCRSGRVSFRGVARLIVEVCARMVVNTELRTQEPGSEAACE